MAHVVSSHLSPNQCLHHSPLLTRRRKNPQHYSFKHTKKASYPIHYITNNGPNPTQFHEKKGGIFTNSWWAEMRGALGQRFNPEGILCSVRVISRDKQQLLSQLTVPDIRYIDWQELHRRGFKGVIFDKDNTLTLPYALTLWDPLKPSLARCKSVFGESNVAVLSNSAGLTEFDPDESKAIVVEKAMGLRVIRHRVKKPAGVADEIENQLGCSANELIMVGDRRFTDVVFGNRNGFVTVLTQPLSAKGEPFVVRVIRRVEAFLVWDWCRNGLRPVDHAFLSCDDAHLVCLDDPICH